MVEGQSELTQWKNYNQQKEKQSPRILWYTEKAAVSIKHTAVFFKDHYRKGGWDMVFRFEVYISSLRNSLGDFPVCLLKGLLKYSWSGMPTASEIFPILMFEFLANIELIIERCNAG